MRHLEEGVEVCEFYQVSVPLGTLKLLKTFHFSLLKNFELLIKCALFMHMATQTNAFTF